MSYIVRVPLRTRLRAQLWLAFVHPAQIALERVRWAVLLRLESRAMAARHSLTLHRNRRTDHMLAIERGRLGRFIDRISPFDPQRGYTGHRKIRWWAYTLATWRDSLVVARDLRVIRALARWAPGPGRYEGALSPLKADWLDTHSEYASSTTGDIEWGAFHELFVGLPWAPDGAAITCIDSQGFFTFDEYATENEAQAAFGTLERSYAGSLEAEDYADLFDDGMWPEVH